MQGKEPDKTVMIECRNLKKSYDHFKALDDLNINIIRGEIFAFTRAF